MSSAPPPPGRADLRNRPGSTSPGVPTARDLLRDRLIVTASALVWIIGTLIGLGVLGSRDGTQQGEGVFDDTATLIAPAGPAFSIWSLIYVGLAAFVVWQWLPFTSASPMARAVRIPAAWSLALNGLWLVVVDLGWIGVSVAVMAGLVVSLGIVLARLADLPGEGIGAALAVGLTFGGYLGWVCVAACANVAAWLVGLGVPAEGRWQEWVTIALLAVVVALTAFLTWRARRPSVQLGLTLAVTWGLTWICVGRVEKDPPSELVGWAALGAATLVLALGIARVMLARTQGLGSEGSGDH